MKSHVRAMSPAVISLVIACSSGTTSSGFGGGGDPARGSTGGDAAQPGSPPALGDGGGSGTLGGNGNPLFDAGPHPTGTCAISDPNADQDHDGWSPAAGDCNDCDPNVNPGAIDVLHVGDGGPPSWGDEDCDGKPGGNAQACDQGLALDDTNPLDAAKAIELCAQATDSGRSWGVLSATYVRADGTSFGAPGLQTGIQNGFGSNVHAQGGANMLVLSTGHARTVGQPGACNGISCKTNATGTAPPGFPQDDPSCPPTKVISDDIALELKLRVPTNATGYSLDFKFYSFEYPDWVCDSHGYNDQFIALVSPAPVGSYVPAGSSGGNISFDGNHHPVSVNLGFFDACDSTTPQRFASHCKTADAGACPTLPSPYCPLGLADLVGTGYDAWHSAVGPGGATRWLQSQAPAKPGSVITVRLAIWDAGNTQYDSTVLLDHFQWVANGGTVAVGTTPVPAPR